MIIHLTKVQNPDLGPITLLQSLPTCETRAFLNFPIFPKQVKQGKIWHPVVPEKTWSKTCQLWLVVWYASTRSGRWSRLGLNWGESLPRRVCRVIRWTGLTLQISRFSFLPESSSAWRDAWLRVACGSIERSGRWLIRWVEYCSVKVHRYCCYTVTVYGDDGYLVLRPVFGE